MRDDLHKTAKCPPAWQELFRLGLNAADRANPERLNDAAVKACGHELDAGLSSALKSLLRQLQDQPSFLAAHELIAGYEPATPFEVTLVAELRAATGPEGFRAALNTALGHQRESYMREFDCRMVEGRIYDRAAVEAALRNAVTDPRISEVCDAFLRQQKIEPKAEGLNVDEVLAPGDKKKEHGR
jgi:hypothetical protein